MRYPELADFCQIGWTTDLHKWGLIVSYWINPREWDFKANAPKTATAEAYLYKHKNGDVHIARNYEDQVVIHKKYGVPLVGPGEQFRKEGNSNVNTT